MRRLVGAGLVLVVALALFGCSDDDNAGDESPGGDRSSSTTTSVSGADAVEDQASELSEAVVRAEGSFCELMLAANESFEAQPSTPGQAKVAIESIAGFLRGLAAADGVDASTAEQLDATAQQLVDAAVDVDYDPQALAEGSFVQILQDPGFVSSMQALATRASSECASAETTSTSVPG
jgi:hypothetical protein